MELIVLLYVMLPVTYQIKCDGKYRFSLTFSVEKFHEKIENYFSILSTMGIKFLRGQNFFLYILAISNIYKSKNKLL